MNRHSIRFQNFNYAKPGFYFVTICTKNRKPIFGHIVGYKMKPSIFGKICIWCWESIPKHFSNTRLDVFQLMPDHFHGILELKSTVGVQYIEPLQHRYQHTTPQSIGSIIRSFKSSVTRIVRKTHPDLVLWQRNYYERVVRNEAELDQLREYIRINPELDHGLKKDPRSIHNQP